MFSTRTIGIDAVSLTNAISAGRSQSSPGDAKYVDGEWIDIRNAIASDFSRIKQGLFAGVIGSNEWTVTPDREITSQDLRQLTDLELAATYVMMEDTTGDIRVLGNHLNQVDTKWNDAKFQHSRLAAFTNALALDINAEIEHRAKDAYRTDGEVGFKKYFTDNLFRFMPSFYPGDIEQWVRQREAEKSTVQPAEKSAASDVPPVAAPLQGAFVK